MPSQLGYAEAKILDAELSEAVASDAYWMWVTFGVCCSVMMIAGVSILAVSWSAPGADGKPPEVIGSDSSGDRPPDSSRGVTEWWAALCAALFFMACLCDGLLLTCIISLTPQLGRIYRVGDPWIGFLFGSKSIVQIISAPFVGVLINRIGHRSVICWGLLVEVLTATMYALSGNVYALAVCARAIQGIASCSILVGSQSFISSVAPESSVGTLLGAVFTGLSVGVLMGPTFGGWLASPSVAGIYGMFWAFAGFAALTLIVNLLVLFVALPDEVIEKLQSPGKSDHEDSEDGDTLGQLLQLARTTPALRILAAALAYNATIAALEPLAPLWAVGRLGVAPDDSSKLGLMWALAPLAFVVCTPVGGVLSDRCPKHLLMALGMWSMLTGLIGLRFTSSAFGSVPLYECALVIIGAGAGFIDAPGQAAIADALTQEWQAAGFAAFDMAAQLGFLLGPVVALSGILSLGMLLVLFAVVVALCSFLLLVKPFGSCEATAQKLKVPSK